MEEDTPKPSEAPESPKKTLVVRVQQESQPGASKGWIWGLVLGILALLLISVFGFLAWRNGKKLAKALHDKDRLEEEIKQADVARRIEEEEDKIDAATAVMSSLLDQHLSATVEVTRLEREYERTKQTLDELTSWDAIDEYLNRKRPTE